ncbi:hypothetical protein FA13DRAFT_1745151 [Coprinellus micaceus]|uniref:Uncharacterized protein n=1 Tax=Coprinellus micaceus TaxID=71717 RepID=A0A4Y7SC65_COPMI|nr:hypothetical protein FA13DRAFT_1745151 [Coprinellus micaceus]
MGVWLIALVSPSGFAISGSVKLLIKVEQEDLRNAATSLVNGRFGCTVRRTPRGTLGSRLELHRKVEVKAQLLSRRGSQLLLQSSVLSLTPISPCAAFRAGGGIEGKEKLALPCASSLES